VTEEVARDRLDLKVLQGLQDKMELTGNKDPQGHQDLLEVTSLPLDLIQDLLT